METTKYFVYCGMNANELRIGNWVNHKYDGNYQIIRNDFCDRTFLDRIKPIPLTKDWLLKFGFEEGEYTEYTFDTYILNGVSLWNKNKDFSLLVFEGFNQLQIKHVHQLQNLYFALTQKELTIKETVK